MSTIARYVHFKIQKFNSDNNNQLALSAATYSVYCPCIIFDKFRHQPNSHCRVIACHTRGPVY